MLPWWGWVLLWGVLVVGGGLWVGWRARATWRSAKALSAEVARAGDLVARLEAAAGEFREDPVGPPAVTQDPHRVRQEYRDQRARSVAARRARREERRPPWARVH